MNPKPTESRLVAALLFCCLLVSVAYGTVADLRAKFQDPPENARIMMRWWWFGPAVTKPEIERELRKMKEGGIGGVEVQPVYPLLPDDPANGIKNIPYLSDEFLDVLRFTALKCKELGMRFDLTLGSGWSFGGAKTPISEAAGQLRVERVKAPPSTTSVLLPSMIPAEKLVAAFVRTVSPSNQQPLLEESVGDTWHEVTNIKDGAVWLQPASYNVELMFFISSRSGMQVKRPSFGAEGYVLNHLDKPSVENYLRSTGDRLFQAFDKTTIPYSIFCDSLEVYNQDWTDDFLAEFQRRRGYDLKPYLPALIENGRMNSITNAAKIADIRYDWGRTITELFNERFMVPMQAWAKAHGTRFRIQGYGIPPAAISSNQWADIADGEGAQWKVVRAARWASSANHIYGRNVTSSETWTWLHSPVFRATPLDLKAEADIHFLQGINQLIGHGWAYTPPQVEYPGWRFYAAGEYSEDNPWWIVMPDLARYLQRMSWLMRQGIPQNDVALYLPNADAYARFTAGKVHLIDVERELVGDKLMPSIFEAGFNLDFFDDEMLKTNTGDVLEKHKVVVLPGIERMPLESLKKLEAFAEKGGSIVVTRRFPSLVPGLKTIDAEQAEFTALAKRLFGGTYKTVKFVERDEDAGTQLRSLINADASDVNWAAMPTSTWRDLGFVHRKTQDADVYFIANTSNRKRDLQLAFRTNFRKAEIWDAISGQITPVKSGNTISVDLEPYQSRVVVFSNESSTGKAPSVPSQLTSTIDLNSYWTVSFNPGRGSIEEGTLRVLAETDQSPHSWTDDQATKYFSGTASYQKDVTVDGTYRSAILDFGDGKPLEDLGTRNGMQTWYDPPIREAAVIYVNGQRAGSLWAPPYKLEIAKFLKPGRNQLRIVVGNTALNYMAGRKLPDYKLLNLRYGERFQPQDMDKIQPVASGITGSVKLRISQ
jgi:hypothetical protein